MSSIILTKQQPSWFTPVYHVDSYHNRLFPNMIKAVSGSPWLVQCINEFKEACQRIDSGLMQSITVEQQNRLYLVSRFITPHGRRTRVWRAVKHLSDTNPSFRDNGHENLFAYKSRWKQIVNEVEYDDVQFIEFIEEKADEEIDVARTFICPICHTEPCTCINNPINLIVDPTNIDSIGRGLESTHALIQVQCQGLAQRDVVLRDLIEENTKRNVVLRRLVDENVKSYEGLVLLETACNEVKAAFRQYLSRTSAVSPPRGQ